MVRPGFRQCDGETLTYGIQGVTPVGGIATLVAGDGSGTIGWSFSVDNGDLQYLGENDLPRSYPLILNGLPTKGR